MFIFLSCLSIFIFVFIFFLLNFHCFSFYANCFNIILFDLLYDLKSVWIPINGIFLTIFHVVVLYVTSRMCVYVNRMRNYRAVSSNESLNQWYRWMMSLDLESRNDFHREMLIRQENFHNWKKVKNQRLTSLNIIIVWLIHISILSIKSLIHFKRLFSGSVKTFSMEIIWRLE